MELKAVPTLQYNPVVELLKRTRALISDPDRWIQGFALEFRLNQPTRRCVTSAARVARLEITCGKDTYVEAMEALNDTIKAKYCISEELKRQSKEDLKWQIIVPGFNDTVKHAEVLQALDITIKRLE